MPVRVSRATSVIVHRVPAAAADRFLALQNEITLAAEKFPGYQATEVYPPADDKGTEWVVVIHFTDEAAMKGWLDSTARAECVAKLQKEIGEFRQETLASGFGAWFTTPKGCTPPPGWKMVLTVLLGLYPTVILLLLTVGKLTDELKLGLAVSMVIANAMSVSILQYFVMPVLTRVFAWWINANGPSDGKKTAQGIAIIFVLLAILTVIFRQITG
jgi:antibiotic biosynthesis monooxygenase (ABM) superfamily enzyme